MGSAGGKMKGKITDDQVIALYGKKTVKDIAEELGVSQTAVFDRARKLGITGRQRRKKVIEEVEQRNGEEVMRRADEFKCGLEKMFTALEKDIDDCLALEEHEKRRIDKESKNRWIQPKSIRRLLRLKDWKMKRMKEVMILIEAFNNRPGNPLEFFRKKQHSGAS